MSECAPSGSVPAGSCHVASHSCVHTLAFVDLEPQPYLTFYISLASSLQCLGTLAPPVPNPVYSMLHLAQNLTVRWELPLGVGGAAVERAVQFKRGDRSLSFLSSWWQCQASGA